MESVKPIIMRRPLAGKLALWPPVQAEISGRRVGLWQRGRGGRAWWSVWWPTLYRPCSASSTSTPRAPELGLCMPSASNARSILRAFEAIQRADNRCNIVQVVLISPSWLLGWRRRKR
jgi:hypothetical protein